MKLLVIRHAIAMDRKDYQLQARAAAREAGQKVGEASDDYRPLTPEGIRKMKKNAEGLAELAGRPDLLVTSPLTRAMQTAEILRGVWRDVELATCEELRPGSEPVDFLKWLKHQPQALKSGSTVAIVGHEPHLSMITSWMMSGLDRSQIILKKGGACMIEFPSHPERSKGQLAWLATPAILRGMR